MNSLAGQYPKKPECFILCWRFSVINLFDLSFSYAFAMKRVKYEGKNSQLTVFFLSYKIELGGDGFIVASNALFIYFVCLFAYCLFVVEFFFHESFDFFEICLIFVQKALITYKNWWNITNVLTTHTSWSRKKKNRKAFENIVWLCVCLVESTVKFHIKLKVSTLLPFCTAVLNIFYTMTFSKALMTKWYDWFKAHLIAPSKICAWNEFSILEVTTSKLINILSWNRFGWHSKPERNSIQFLRLSIFDF